MKNNSPDKRIPAAGSPDSGRAAFGTDPYLEAFRPVIARRHQHRLQTEKRLTGGGLSLADFSSGHEYFGLHRTGTGWVFREWAPNATAIFLTGTFNRWQESAGYALNKISTQGVWEIHLSPDDLGHGDLYRLKIHWPGGCGDRIPAYARRVVQDDHTKIFNAQVWTPPPFEWQHTAPHRPVAPLIYESHVGMAQEKAGIGTYREFRENILPRIAGAGYNTVQLMAVMEHPYYGSFGYHVSSFFAASSRFGTPEELKELVDAAHGLGLTVIMDLIHSHAVNNEVEGLSCFDGTRFQYFHAGERGMHVAWDSRCFDYYKPEVLHLLLSNCRFWLDEYRMDGFRFDGVTSMLYHDRGLGRAFTSYDRYFDGGVDEDALTYLALANQVIHAVRPDAITVAEDVSGMPGLAAPLNESGSGFDYRLAMGVPDCWFKLVNDTPDEDWSLDFLWHELSNRRQDEKTISYVECHDQAIVGGKTLIFSLIDKDMYTAMHAGNINLQVDRGMALHKMIRLATLASAGHGYLNFMGNEFGHPEWIDFPREGNHWSYHYARRQWSLRDNPDLRYHFLADFDRAMVTTLKASGIIPAAPLHHRVAHQDDKVLAFERGNWLFIFNFHPNRSYTDYAIKTQPGRYAWALDTDQPEFGGHARLQPHQIHLTHPAENPKEKRLLLYLPARSALVLHKLD